MMQNRELTHRIEAGIWKWEGIPLCPNNLDTGSVTALHGLFDESGYGLDAADKQSGERFLQTAHSAASSSTNIEDGPHL
jgi:hypothetical protein